jgi:hypothetical protein
MKLEVGTLDVTGRDLVAAVGLIAATAAIIEGVIPRELYVTVLLGVLGYYQIVTGRARQRERRGGEK